MFDQELCVRLRACKDYPKPFNFDNLELIGLCHKIHDGDSFRATVEWKNELTSLTIRVAGIDCPEISAKRGTLERDLAELAKSRVEELVDHQLVRLQLMGYGKYGGRVITRVFLEDGRELSAILINEGLAFAYDGATKRKDWENLPDRTKAS